MAIPAVKAKVANVVLMAEWYRLLAWNTYQRDVRRGVVVSSSTE
jgi:hypothetical protein